MVGHYVSSMADNAFSRGKLAIRNQVNIRAANNDEIRTLPTRRAYCSASYCAFGRCSFTDGTSVVFSLSLPLFFFLLFQEATTVSRVPQSCRSYFSPLSPRSPLQSASKAAYAPVHACLSWHGRPRRCFCRQLHRRINVRHLLHPITAECQSAARTIDSLSLAVSPFSRSRGTSNWILVVHREPIAGESPPLRRLSRSSRIDTSETTLETR